MREHKIWGMRYFLGQLSQKAFVVSNTHSKGEWVKIPLLPNRVGKRSGTMTMVTTISQ